MTEDEANQKWCPHARMLQVYSNMAGVGAIAVNREDNMYTRCLASDCMSWRWMKGDFAKPTEDRGALGYCGLAGKP